MKFMPTKPNSITTFSKFFLAMLVVICAHTTCFGQVFYPEDAHEELASPILDNEPFDLIYLGEYDKYAIMKVVPFEKALPDPKPERGVLVFDFANELESRFQVPWDRVTQVKKFNQILLEEAENWLKEKNYPKAFRNLLYVYDHGGNQDAKIVGLIQDCLFLDGTANFKSENYELALSIFEDMYQRDQDFKPKGLDKTGVEIVMACYDGIARKHFENADFLKTRNMLTAVRKQYPEDSGPLLKEWEKKFAGESDKLIARARELAQQGDGIGAHNAARNANTIYPNRAENKALYKQVLAQYPIVFVGVTQGPGDADPTSLHNWGARRVGRLTQRTIVEFTGLTDEGGRYDFLNGTIAQSDSIGFEYEFKINPDKKDFGVPEISAFEVSQIINTAAGDEESPYYSQRLAKILHTIRIIDDKTVGLRLRVPFVRPESLMQLPYAPRDENNQPVENGPYITMELDDQRKLSTFARNPAHAKVEGRQHPTVIEKSFSTASDAVDALMKGDIDIVDRIPIADRARLKKSKEIVVRPYTVPTMHMLIPNQREDDDFGRDSNFRGGLLRGINRENLVNEMICNGVEVSGCQVVSGPFPAGTLDNDQIGYAYNRRAPNMPYNFKLGMVLVNIVHETMISKLRDQGVQDASSKVSIPTVILAYPKNDVAKIACTSIARDWSVLGVQTQLRELDGNTTIPDDDRWDYLYVDAMITEPLVDASKLLGQRGLSDNVSATIEQSTKMLSEAHSWQKACATLRRLHRQSTNEVAIIPLFQLTEFYAYRTNVHDVGRELIHLYQNVERWRIDSVSEEKQ